MLLNWLSSKYRNIVTYRHGGNRVYSGNLESTSGRFTGDFIGAATADVRCPKAMVEVTWANSSVDTNLVLLSNDINRINRTGQLFNGRTESGQKWAYIHSGLKADGTFNAMPELDKELQAGWYGSELVCDGAGVFAVKPNVDITHDARSYSAITVVGDSVYNEFPVDFTITYTHAGGPTVQAITGNTERVYSEGFTPIADVTGIKIEISKWSAPNTIVKIIQFAGSLIDFYRSDEIVELSVLEETNSDTGIVPIGNVSANELDLSLLNTDRRFSHGNTASIYATSVKSGRKIRVWLGFVLPAGSSDQTGDVDGYIVETVNGDKIGYMPYGTFWSKDWISSYNSQETTTAAYDVTYLLSQKDFLRSQNYNGTVASIVNDILEEAKLAVPDLKWRVSTDTGSIVWANVEFQAQSYLEVLKDIAEASLSYTYVDRNGKLVVGSLLEKITPVEPWQEVDLSVYYNYESNPKLDELINFIRVGYTRNTPGEFQVIYNDSDEFTIPLSGVLIQPLTWSTTPVTPSTVVAELTNVTGDPELTNIAATEIGGSITVTGAVGDTFRIKASGVSTEPRGIYASDEVFTIPAGGVFNVFIAWSTSPVNTSTVTVALADVTGAPLLTNLDAYAYGGDVEVTGAPGDTFRLTARGVAFTTLENTETTAEDAASVALYGVREFALTGNTIITTLAQATILASSLITSYGGLRQDGSMSWPASTLLAVGDTLLVTEFKSDAVETKDYFLIKRQTTKFTGAMQAQTELRRG